jgi:hypothetical protein
MRTAVVASLCVLMLAACQQSNNTSVTRIRAANGSTFHESSNTAPTTIISACSLNGGNLSSPTFIFTPPSPVF